jgi:hypothetical protein
MSGDLNHSETVLFRGFAEVGAWTGGPNVGCFEVAAPSKVPTFGPFRGGFNVRKSGGSRPSTLAKPPTFAAQDAPRNSAPGLLAESAVAAAAAAVLTRDAGTRAGSRAQRPAGLLASAGAGPSVCRDDAGAHAVRVGAAGKARGAGAARVERPSDPHGAFLPHLARRGAAARTRNAQPRSAIAMGGAHARAAVSVG